ncbi:MAG TPA: CHC2 zinc finger domain-containing protein [Methylophilaceae bacterium]|nr:CHC2 zinc finger domain-containing protein [Methylophilaceae bacterium]
MIDKLLSRLDKVKRTTNNSWLACCPAHDDRSPSLTLTDRDGRILIHCFAGCSTESVIGAIGLDWDDILPERAITHHQKPEQTKVYATDALRAIQHEARIVTIAAFQLKHGNHLNAEDLSRLSIAMDRINTALELANVS